MREMKSDRSEAALDRIIHHVMLQMNVPEHIKHRDVKVAYRATLMVMEDRHIMEAMMDFSKVRPLAKYLDGARKDRFIAALDLFDQGLRDKQIWNAEYADAYSYGLSRGLEDIYGKVLSKYRSKLQANQFADDVDSLFATNSIKKIHRHWTSKRKDYPELAEIMDAMADVPDLIKELKKYIVKGRKPTEASIAREKARAAIDPRTKDKLYKLFKQIGDGLKDDYYAEVYKTMERAVMQAKPAVEGKTYSQIFGAKGSHKAHMFKELLRRVYRPDSKIRGMASMSDPYILDSNWKATVEKEAQYVTDLFHNSFIEKNAMKLNGILKDREIKSMKHNIRGRDLTGSLLVDMADGSGFTMTFNVVTKVSPLGKWFNQFPTRFTNVVMPDGTRMKTPSEAKMKSDF